MRSGYFAKRTWVFFTVIKCIFCANIHNNPLSKASQKRRKTLVNEKCRTANRQLCMWQQLNVRCETLRERKKTHPCWGVKIIILSWRHKTCSFIKFLLDPSLLFAYALCVCVHAKQCDVYLYMRVRWVFFNGYNIIAASKMATKQEPKCEWEITFWVHDERFFCTERKRRIIFNRLSRYWDLDLRTETNVENNNGRRASTCINNIFSFRFFMPDENYSFFLLRQHNYF